MPYCIMNLNNLNALLYIDQIKLILDMNYSL